jgi:hypothetical protein
MCIALHPFLIGQPHRIKYLDEILDYINQNMDRLRLLGATGAGCRYGVGIPDLGPRMVPLGRIPCARVGAAPPGRPCRLD